jgi:hypothetical protein
MQGVADRWMPDGRIPDVVTAPTNQDFIQACRQSQQAQA